MDQLDRRLIVVTCGAAVILGAVAVIQHTTGPGQHQTSQAVRESAQSSTPELTDVATAWVVSGQITHPDSSQTFRAGHFRLQNDASRQRSVLTLKLQPKAGKPTNVAAQLVASDSDIKQTELVTVQKDQDGGVSDVFTDGVAQLRRSTDGKINGLTMELGPSGSEHIDVALSNEPTSAPTASATDSLPSAPRASAGNSSPITPH